MFTINENTTDLYSIIFVDQRYNIQEYLNTCKYTIKLNIKP